MITKIILMIILVSLVLSFVIDVILPKEREVIDKKTSNKKHSYYIDYDWMQNRHYYDYEYFGETTSEDETVYIYHKYLTKYKWDRVNWLKIKTLLKKSNLLLLAILVICLGISGIASFNNSKRINVLEHQRNYVNELNEEVDIIVKSFMQHEEITFDRDVSLEALIITYPELRSVELVTNQLETLKKEKQKLNEIEVNLIKYETIKKWFGLGIKGD